MFNLPHSLSFFASLWPRQCAVETRRFLRLL